MRYDVLLLASALFALAGCGGGKTSETASTSAGVACVEDPGPGFRVRRVTPPQEIKIGDHSLGEWKPEQVVMEIPANRARQLQWAGIGDRTPGNVTDNDLSLRVYMASDSRYWNIGIDAQDDVIVPVSPESAFPYSGDCVEFFWAGARLDSERDIHDLIGSAASPQRAFFQLDIPPVELRDPESYLPEWRTDPEFRRRALAGGFAVSVWRDGGGWKAEARIPIDPFEEDVKNRVQKKQPLKLAITYLDYDVAVAPRTAQANWGFYPDNVFSLDAGARQVSTPRCMRSVVFE